MVMKKGPGFEIGGQVFQTFFNNQDLRLSNLLNKSWERFTSRNTEKGCRVEILPYSHGHKPAWNPSELAKFRKYFLNIHRRYPSDDRFEEVVEKSMDILKCLDPEQEQILSIKSGLEHAQTMIYARIGDDLFFFNTRLNLAFFFIKKRTRLSLGIFNIFTWTHSMTSFMMAGIMNGFMFILSHLLIHHGGLLLHGAAVQKQGRSVLFLGFSGAGKSTITRLCEPDICFSDDGVVIKKEKNRLYAYHSPFTQYHRNDENSAVTKGEISKIFLLTKDTYQRVFPIKKNKLMHTIVMHLIHFFKYLNDETAQRGFYLVKEILDDHPAYQLKFAKREIMWDNIIKVEERGTKYAGSG